MKYRILVLPGDGVGPEVTAEAVKVLNKVAGLHSFSLEYEYALIGGAAYDAVGVPLPEETLALCPGVDAVLLGAIGGPQWDQLPPTLRPESGLLGIRSHLGLYANLRPAKVSTPLISASPLKREVVEGVDLVIVRELAGGIYYGTPRGIVEDGALKTGINTEIYSTPEIERIAHTAFRLAEKRRKKVTSVDKANVLESSQLWREVVTRVGKEYPEVTLDYLYVDNCAMQLVTNPRRFDVILTNNIFGDILSDEAAVITGSIGMLPSASLGTGRALYEPVHGSAPDIAGRGIANPLATILSAAMLVELSLKQPEAAGRIVSAVEKVLDDGFRTADIAAPGQATVGTIQMGDLVVERL
jgi:3-isopropylmalate dehydrogenase